MQNETEHKIGDMVVVNFSTDYEQAMARKDSGIVIDIREDPNNGETQLKIQWQEGGRIWSRPEILKVISRAE
jgi:hypothetical protein